MSNKLGSKIGMLRFATIVKFNNNAGTVRIALDEAAGLGSINEFTAPVPAAWTGPSGEFIGGCPTVGSSVVVGQGHGGQWFVISYINSNNVFDQSFVSTSNTIMSALRPGRALMQTGKGNRIFVDPEVGAQLGNAKEFLHVDPKSGIISHNFDAEHAFTQAHRKLNQLVKRDINDNVNRNVLGSTLFSQSYDAQLKSIGLDPITAVSGSDTNSSSIFIRNPAFVESREIVYEFADSFNFTNDYDEGNRYADPKDAEISPDVSRRKMRSDALSLSLEYPNHLIESIKGTVVDVFGNILDINRNILPIGRDDKTSLRKSTDKKDAFTKIRALERKSMAFHWELNARKGEEKVDGQELSDITINPPPDPKDKKNYGRNRSRFFIDIDKEGQFKINIPSSSETGNIPLLTRYENYSVILANGMTADGQDINPNEFIRNEDRRDIFINDFANISNIELSGSDDESEAMPSPNDWIVEDNPIIKFGTAYHDITKVCQEFTTEALYLNARPIGGDGKNTLINDDIHPLNTTVEQLEAIVSTTINVLGKDANAGGRSGVVNFDGFVSFNFGANTVDRQSIFIDTAGGVVSRLGRDRQNISYAASLDGDMFVQIGGSGIGNDKDSRFEATNDGFRGGTLDIRVLNDSGMSAIIRIDPTGLHLSTPGRLTLWAEQDIIMKSVRGDIKMEAENIIAYSETSKRRLGRFPDQQEYR